MAKENISFYGGRVCVQFDKGRHHYTVGNQTIDGVTSITGVIAKPQLMPWYASEAANYVRENWEIGKPYSAEAIEAICTAAKGAANRKRDKSADIGHLVHAWCENFIKSGTRDEFPASPEARNGCEAFLRWHDEHVDHILGCEKKVFSEENLYAGTFDLTYVDKQGRRILADLKTGNAIYPEMWFQTAGYELALREEYGDEGKYDAHVLINARKTGELFVEENTDYVKNATTFLAANLIYKRLKELKK